MCVELQITLNMFFLCVSVVSDCVSISAFASLVGFHVGIMSSAVGIKTCAITAGIKMCKSNIKKKKKNLWWWNSVISKN